MNSRIISHAGFLELQKQVVELFETVDCLPRWVQGVLTGDWGLETGQFTNSGGAAIIILRYWLDWAGLGWENTLLSEDV